MANESRGERFAALVGAELRGAIASRGYSAAAVARSIGNDPATLSRWLTGKREVPVSVAMAIADYVGVSLAEVMDRAYARLDEEVRPSSFAGMMEAARGPRIDPMLHDQDDYVLAALDRNDDAEVEAWQEHP